MRDNLLYSLAAEHGEQNLIEMGVFQHDAAGWVVLCLHKNLLKMPRARLSLPKWSSVHGDLVMDLITPNVMDIKDRVAGHPMVDWDRAMSTGWTRATTARG